MDKLYVIKIGGNIVDDASKLADFLRAFTKIGERKILVHGGGKLATRLAEQLQIPQRLVEGRRITDAETLKVITMVYAGYINKNIVAALQANGCNAIGLTGADADMIRAHKRTHATLDYGFVGDVDKIETGVIHNFIELGLSPVVAPVTHDLNGQLLNTNADTIAQELGKALSQRYDVALVYSFEKKGVLLNVEDEGSVLSKITAASYQELKEKKQVFAGMIPKLDNAFAALHSGVKQVIIGQAEEIEALIEGRSGTSIING